MVDNTSELEHGTTDYTLVRDEEPPNRIGHFVERGLEARNMVEGLCIAADKSVTSSSTVTKLSATALTSRSCAPKRCFISVSVYFSRSSVGLTGAADDTPLP